MQTIAQLRLKPKQWRLCDTKFEQQFFKWHRTRKESLSEINVNNQAFATDTIDFQESILAFDKKRMYETDDLFTNNTPNNLGSASNEMGPSLIVNIVEVALCNLADFLNLIFHTIGNT